MRYGRLRQDCDSHWYVVPEERVQAFDALAEKIEGVDYLDAEDDFIKFESEFGEFRIDRPQDVAVLMEDSRDGV